MCSPTIIMAASTITQTSDMTARFHRNRNRFLVTAMVMVESEKIEMTLNGATKACRIIPELMYRLYASAGRCINCRSDTTESLDEPKKLGIPTAMSSSLSYNAQRVLGQPCDKEDKEEGDEPAKERESIGNRYQDFAHRPDVSPCRGIFFVFGRDLLMVAGQVRLMPITGTGCVVACRGGPDPNARYRVH